MIERITKEFFNSGKSFDEFLEDATEDEAKRFRLYYRRSAKKFTPEQFRIDIDRPINLLVTATTWCWDSQTNLQILVHIANNSPKVNLKILNQDKYPFLAIKVKSRLKVPQILVFSENFYYLDRWVERSTLAYQLYAKFRKQYGWKEENRDEFLKQYRTAYLRDQQNFERSVIDEIHALLKRAEAVSSATSSIND